MLANGGRSDAGANTLSLALGETDAPTGRAEKIQVEDDIQSPAVTSPCRELR